MLETRVVPLDEVLSAHAGALGADLEGNERVTAGHLAEAISYRPRLSAEEANRLDSAALAPIRSSARPS